MKKSKNEYYHTCKECREVTNFPELAYYSAGGMTLILHQAAPDKYYAEVRGDCIDVVWASDTREGIFALLNSFKRKYPQN